MATHKAPAREPRPGPTRIKKAAILALVVVLGLALIEGLASIWHVGVLLATKSSAVLAARTHTRYDPDLGWVHRPDSAFPDLYRENASMHINGQGFRARHEFAVEVPAGRVRVICSGDSFALGYGVDDTETWCHQLEVLDPRLETVNMGQGGYGLGQSYLWYLRDGTALSHDVHLFTFIFEDFARLGETVFLGYGKPRLELEDGQLVTNNVPVPRAAYRAPWFTQNAWILYELRTLALFRGAVQRMAGPAPRADPNLDVHRITLRIFEQLRDANGAAGRSLVLVYLPRKFEHRGNETAEFRRFLADESRRRGIRFVDLVPELRRIPEGRIDSLFIAEGAIDYPAAAGHYTAEGNRLVAEWLLAAGIAGQAGPEPQR